MTQPKYAKVDPGDYERLRKSEWFVKKGRNCFYAFRRLATGKTGNKKLIYMHREIIEVGDEKMVDHINYDGMDNRSCNLRAATHSENMCHRKKSSRATHSKYKGIQWHKDIRKWQVEIRFNKKRMYLGCFRNEIEAAKAYDRGAMKYHGEFACLNFPEKG